MLKASNVQLLPCPFCGCEPTVRTNSRQFPLSVECPGCNTLGPAGTSDVVSQWNTRRIGGNLVTFQWERPGVISENGVWFIVSEGYMYGPCEKWQDVERIAREEWQCGRHIVG